MAKDFFDDDLVGRGIARDQVEDRDGVPVRPISEAGLTRMIRQKQELSEQVAGAVKEIEQLRTRQETLQKEKGELEELTRRQEEYTTGKKDIMDKLAKSIVCLEKDEVHAARMAELLSVMRQRFKDALGELRGINEAGWLDENYEVELNKALVLIEEARGVYRKGLTKIDAEGWHRVTEGKVVPAVLTEAPRELGDRRSFGFWLRVGVAVSLPVITALALLFAAWVFLTRRG